MNWFALKKRLFYSHIEALNLRRIKLIDKHLIICLTKSNINIKY